jgi:hypothetical protein
MDRRFWLGVAALCFVDIGGAFASAESAAWESAEELLVAGKLAEAEESAGMMRRGLGWGLCGRCAGWRSWCRGCIGMG